MGFHANCGFEKKEKKRKKKKKRVPPLSESLTRFTIKYIALSKYFCLLSWFLDVIGFIFVSSRNTFEFHHPTLWFARERKWWNTFQMPSEQIWVETQMVERWQSRKLRGKVWDRNSRWQLLPSNFQHLPRRWEQIFLHCQKFAHRWKTLCWR